VKYELILIRYGEIALKGKETRRRFENVLITNIKNALESKNLSFKIKKEWGRIYVYTNQINKSINVLKKVFGIISISPAIQTSSNLDSISKLAISLSKTKLKKKISFAIRASRIGQHNFSSQDVAIKIGNDVVKSTEASVNLTKPDLELFIEIRNDTSFLFTERISCVRGMPLGTQGNVLALIDNKKSILAAWYLMRRGCKTIFLKNKKFNDKILKSFNEKWLINLEISTSSRDDFFDEIKRLVNEKKCNAIVTGYTLYNNNKQKLFEINQLKEQVNLPILYPLIAMGENEIDNKSKEIGLKL
jgi:thiamine biosynthesis protein ThiI